MVLSAVFFVPAVHQPQQHKHRNGPAIRCKAARRAGRIAAQRGKAHRDRRGQDHGHHMEAELKNVNAELARAPFDEYAAKAEKVGGTLTSVGQKLLPLSTSIAGLGVAAVKTTADFDSEMSKVSAISGATGTDLDKLRGKAREMGAKTKFSASEAAQGMQYMAMAGWKTQDMMDGLEGIMNLAAASGEDLASTSDIVTDALTAFGLSAKIPVIF